MSYDIVSILSKFWRCPNCSGLGHLMDGQCTIGSGGCSQFTPATKCSVCRGKRVVLVIPVPESELVGEQNGI